MIGLRILCGLVLLGRHHFYVVSNRHRRIILIRQDVDVIILGVRGPQVFVMVDLVKHIVC